MKKKTSLVIIVVVFILLIAGASVLYEKLSAQVEVDRLAVQSTRTPAESPTASPSTAPENTQNAAQDGVQGEAQGETEYTFAPDFTVYDGEGNEVRLHDYLGKPIVLNFWASWCQPCQMEMPDFHEKYLEIGEDVHFLMVNMTTGRETKQSADAFIASAGYTFPILYDTLSEAAITYGAYSLPTTFFIDAEGYVIAYAQGAIDAELLQVGLDMIYFPEG